MAISLYLSHFKIALAQKIQLVLEVSKTKEKRDTYNGAETGNERRNEVLAGSGRHDGVVGSGHGRAVVSGDHDAKFQELEEVIRQVVFLKSFVHLQLS